MPMALTCQPSPPHGERILLVTHHRRSPRSRHDADLWFTRDMAPPRRKLVLEELESFGFLKHRSKGSTTEGFDE